MKLKILISSLLITLFTVSFTQAQIIKPLLEIEDEPQTHNMGICFDGQYYYTVNGGNTTDGQINKYDADGDWLDSYPLKLDARSIMFNPKDKSLYVNAYDNNIYKITDLKLGGHKLVFKELYENEQSSIAMSPDGEQLFALDEGTLKIYDINDGSVLSTFYDIKCGKTTDGGSTAIAVSEDHFFTWNSKRLSVYVYSLDGQLQKTIRISKGDYGYSLSYANNMLFTAMDGNYDIGFWYAYKINEVIDIDLVYPFVSFDENPKTHNMNLCSDGKSIFTVNGGKSDMGMIYERTENGLLKKEFPIKLDMRCIMYSPEEKEFYITVYGTNIYEISKMKKGEYELLSSTIIKNEQSTPSLNPAGTKLYVFNKGQLKVYDFPSLKLVNTLDGLKHGKTPWGGEAVVAVGKKHIYTWDARLQVVYAYDLKGNFVKKAQLANGDWAFSLSYANGLLWVSRDGDYGTGTWYGYDIWKK